MKPLARLAVGFGFLVVGGAWAVKGHEVMGAALSLGAAILFASGERP